MKELQQLILDLPAAHRLQLASFILASLQTEEIGMSGDIPSAWVLEAQESIRTYKQEKVKGYSWEEVKQKLGKQE